MKKIPIITLLEAFGLTSKKILFSIKNPELLTKKKNIANNKLTSKALIKINEITTEQKKNKDLVRLNSTQKNKDCGKKLKINVFKTKQN